MKHTVVSALTGIVAALGLTIASAAVTPAEAAGGSKRPDEQWWSFAGPFGTYDRAQLQRGFKVFKEVCAGCHGLQFVAFRNLGEPGGPEFSEAEVKAIAAEYTIVDGPDAEGEMFEREAKPADRWPSPFPNVEAAAAANGGAAPPDFSLLAKARAVERGFPWFVLDWFTTYQEAGPDYIYALLTGYEEAPDGVEVSDELYYNPYFLGGTAIAMAPPVDDEMVDYTDGTPMTLEHYARDVTAFMMWAAEPKLEERKRIGMATMLYVLAFAGLLFVAKKKVWSSVDH